MIKNYRYELWSGKKAVGYYDAFAPILGNHLIVPEDSIFKRGYRKKRATIKVPIMSVAISDDGIDLVIRRVLDVSRKSHRQIEILTRGMIL